jgi:adenine-specific DNA methylase
LIEKSFDVPFIADLALHEKQIQQNYRPIIAVHKWFARRPGTLFRGLLLSEFVTGNLRDEFFKNQDLAGTRVLDPFMGGGTPLIEANRMGCEVIGWDINPMAYWIVKQEMDYLDTDAYTGAARRFKADLDERIGRMYRSACVVCGSPEAHVKYFIWVKTMPCKECGSLLDLFPGYVLAENRRHPAYVFICSRCGDLNEVKDHTNPGHCNNCGTQLRTNGTAARNRCICPQCRTTNTYPDAEGGPPVHRMVAIEYHCPQCKSSHQGRFFKKPDAEDLKKYAEASGLLTSIRTVFVPDDEIPPGDETDRLHRWGYRRYREMFNDRQLLGLELSCRIISTERDEHIRNALATNLSDLLRYQNMLCRYDAMALKSLDIFSVHGFPVGLLQCESNLLGIVSDNGTNVGSGGWSNIIEKYARAKKYCEKPFETRHQQGRKVPVFLGDEWIGERRETRNGPKRRRIELHCGSSTTARLAPASVDAIFTDPPYFTNVQYAELMDFCYVWLRRLATDIGNVFYKPTTRDEEELTGNATMGKGILHFTEGLSAVFRTTAKALKPGAPFAFTYHHNTIEAYLPIAVALLDAGLKCSASIPCPAEMGASIHINGTGSSIVDTVFVSRSKGTVSKGMLAFDPPHIARLVEADLANLRRGNLNPTRGDIRCVAYGHLVRMAMWTLKDGWNPSLSVQEKLDSVAAAVAGLGGWAAVEQCLTREIDAAAGEQRWAVMEANNAAYEVIAAISF